MEAELDESVMIRDELESKRLRLTSGFELAAKQTIWKWVELGYAKLITPVSPIVTLSTDIASVGNT